MLEGELPRERVEVAQALHRHQKRLVRGKARADQGRHLLPQMIFELRHVHRVDRLPTAEITPPLVDLFLERYRVIWRHVSSSLGKCSMPGEVARPMPAG